MKISIMIFFIVSLGIIVYSNSLGNDFIWDDVAFVVTNDYIKDLKNLPLYFTSKESLAKGTLAGQNFRPLVPLSYAIDYRFWKLNPFGYHLTNTFFHIINAVLVFYLILLITNNKYISLLSSLFFVTHPIQTESVTWIAGRSSVLFLFFYLSSLIYYINYTRKKRIVYICASLILFLLALFSKEMAATLPFILILYGLLYNRKGNAIQKIVSYFPYLLILEIYIFKRFFIIGSFGQCQWWAGNLYLSMLTVARGIMFYFKLLIFPVNLCADYYTFPISTTIKDAQVIFSLLSIASLVIFALIISRKHKNLPFSILWFFITLIPGSNIIPVNIIVAERFLYIPSIGWCFFISVVLVFLYQKFKKINLFKYAIVFGAIFIVAGYSYLTVARNVEWSDEIVFWKKNAEVLPDNPRAHHNLSTAYIAKNVDLEEAYKEVKKAIKLSPNYPFPRITVASYYAHKNLLGKAIRELKYTIKTNPDFLTAHAFLGGIYAFQKKYALAYNEYRKALIKDPNYFEAKLCIADLYFAEGKRKEAILEYEKILRGKPLPHYRPHYAAAYLRLGDVYVYSGDPEKAGKAWKKVVDEYKDQIWFNEVARYLTGELPEGRLLEDTALWQPEFKMVCYYFIGLKKEMDGNFEEAGAYYSKSMNMTTEHLSQIRVVSRMRLENLKKHEKEKI